jgi:signal transduction histidine kinase
MSRASEVTQTRWFRWAAVGVVVALLVATELHALSVGAPFLGFVLPDTVGALMFIASGAVAWKRRPENFTGPMLVAAGAMWFIGSNRASPNGAIASLSWSFGGYYDPALAFLALAFPFGRLHGRLERVVVSSMFGVMVLRTLSRLFLNEPAVYYDCPCPLNPFRLALNQPLYEGVDRATTAALAVLGLAAMVLVLRRLTSGTRTAREVSTPVVIAGAAAMAIGAYHNASEAALLTFGFDLLPRSDRLHQVVAWSLFAGRALVPLGFLIGVLRLRRRRSVVADLVLDLTEPVPREHLRASLVHALGDPTLEVAFWSSDRAAYADEAGRAVHVPVDDPSRAVTVIQRGREPLVALIHDPALLEDPGLVKSVGAALRMAVENERLRARLEEQLQEVRASRARIVAASDAERRRVERDLHDGAQQRLVTLSLALRLARSQAAGARDPALEATLTSADQELKEALAEIRELARGIHPVVLSRAGLGAALRSLAERSPVPVLIDAAPVERFPAPLEAAVYFVVSESLANVAKHAQASRATVSVVTSDGWLHVEVSDDGIGGARTADGSGLLGLEDRVAALGGRLRLDSPANGGTTVVAELPLDRGAG